MFLKRDLEGKVALVTGASSGIGKSTAFAFSRAGASVVIASRRVAEGEQVAHEVCERGGDAIFIKTDVSKASDVESLVSKIVDIYGRLDCAFNNAGIFKVSPLTELSEEDWDSTININLKGVWLCLKYEILQMLKQGGGNIVNMSSIAGLAGRAGCSAYSASKGGIIALTQTTAIEYAGMNIRINAISPAAIKTESLINSFPKEVLSQMDLEHPLGRIGKPEEVAEAAVWLCSDRASFTTGHNLVIDGGYTAQ